MIPMSIPSFAWGIQMAEMLQSELTREEKIARAVEQLKKNPNLIPPINEVTSLLREALDQIGKKKGETQI